VARWRLPWSHSRVLSSVKQVAQLTGPTSINHTHTLEVAGQSLGSMFDAVGRTWFLFGDTLPRDGGTEWRSNTLAYTSDANGFGFHPGLRSPMTHAKVGTVHGHGTGSHINRASNRHDHSPRATSRPTAQIRL